MRLWSKAELGALSISGTEGQRCVAAGPGGNGQGGRRAHGWTGRAFHKVLWYPSERGRLHIPLLKGIQD